MGATRARRNAVHERGDALSGFLGPGEGAFDVQPVLLPRGVEDVRMHPLRSALDEDLADVGGDSVGVVELVALPCRLVVEDHGEAAVQVGFGFESLADQGRVEHDRGEDFPIGVEFDEGSAAAGGTEFLQLGGRDPAREALLPLRTLALHSYEEPIGERRHHRGADAVESARVIVVLRLELSAGVQRRQDQFEGRPLVLLVHVDRDAATVVAHR